MGEQHLQRKEKDEKRDAFLLEQGIETLRIPSLWLFDNTMHTQAYQSILEALERRTGRKADPW
jgi:very-short-patch-repair endonuclease